MKRVLATAGHVDHGKSTLVQALTGRDPDRLAHEQARGLSIDLGFAWTVLPSGADVAFVDVPGHQRFVGTMLAGLGPAPAVLFVVAADQGWAAQSSEHLAALRALGITQGLLVITRADLATRQTQDQVRADATQWLAAAGLNVPACTVSATSGEGMDELLVALDDLATGLPEPDTQAPVRLWCDRAFTIAGAGTVVTGTLAAGTLHPGDHLMLLTGGAQREVVVRGLHSEDLAREQVEPVSRVAVNLRRLETDAVGRGSLLLTPGAFGVAQVIDATLEAVEVSMPLQPPVGSGEAAGLTVPLETPASHGTPASQRTPASQSLTPPEQAILHVGTAAEPVHVRPLGPDHARLTLTSGLPWQVGDRAILRDPGSRRLWAVRVLDVDPLPLRRRGAAARRATDLATVTGSRHRQRTTSIPAASHATATTAATNVTAMLADLRLRSRCAEHADVLARLALPDPTTATRVGLWWIAREALATWTQQLQEQVAAHHRVHPLSQGLTLVEVAHRLGLPAHLRPASEGGTLGGDITPLGPDLIRHLVAATGLTDELGHTTELRLTNGRVHASDAGGLGAAESAVATIEQRLRAAPFAAPERDDLTALGLGPTELAAAVRTGRLLRLTDDIVLLPDGPARAMRELAALDQPFTLSAARQALGTTRRVAVPLLEHLDGRGWTARVDGQLRRVV